MTKIEIEISEDLKKNLVKRAKKNYMNLGELVEDIIRRSMLKYKSDGGSSAGKASDSFVEIFSRRKKGQRK